MWRMSKREAEQAQEPTHSVIPQGLVIVIRSLDQRPTEPGRLNWPTSYEPTGLVTSVFCWEVALEPIHARRFRSAGSVMPVSLPFFEVRINFTPPGEVSTLMLMTPGYQLAATLNPIASTAATRPATSSSPLLRDFFFGASTVSMPYTAPSE